MYLIIRKFDRGIAQLVERRSPKPNVVSSNLTAPANQDKPSERAAFSLYIKHCVFIEVVVHRVHRQSMGQVAKKYHNQNTKLK